MTNVEVLDARPDARGGYKVDVSRGERVGRVSSEWFNRPADERYLSLADLFASVKGRSERSRTRTVESAAVRVEASRDDAERLSLLLPGSDAPVAPTHWSFGQLAGLVGAPAAYLRQLPAALAGINLQYGLTSHRAEQVKTLETDDGRIELRAVTGPDYGRIYDHELVAAVQRIAGNGNHLAALVLPPTLRRLYLARDDDPAGRWGVQTLADRATEVGIEALKLDAALGDFNEDLRKLGLDALAAGVRVQLAPEDVARFFESVSLGRTGKRGRAGRVA